MEANMLAMKAVCWKESPEHMRLNEACLIDGVVSAKRVNPSVKDGMWLRRVPVPAKVHINGTAYDTTEADIELSLPMSATYKIRVEAPKFKDAHFEVVVP